MVNSVWHYSLGSEALYGQTVFGQWSVVGYHLHSSTNRSKLAGINSSLLYTVDVIAIATSHGAMVGLLVSILKLISANVSAHRCHF